jgi:hypothetical protein
MQVRYICITGHSDSGNCSAFLTIGDNIGALALSTVASDLSACCDMEISKVKIMQAAEHITSRALLMYM